MSQARKLVIPDMPAVLLPQQVQGIDKSVLGPDGKTLCQIRKTPLVLYGLFLELVRGLYTPANEAATGGQRVWRDTVTGRDAGFGEPSRTTTDIWIDTEYKWEDLAPGFRPAIFIALGPLTYTSNAFRSISNGDLKEGTHDYYRVVNGTVSFVHIGETKGEGVLLASNTYTLLDSFADVIRQDFDFDKLDVTNFEPMQLTKKDEYRSLVSMSFEYQEAWTIKQESPKLKEFTFRARRLGGELLSSLL